MHQIEYLTYDGTITKGQLEKIANHIAEEKSDAGRLYNSIRFFDCICEDEDDAYEFIEKRDNGDYCQLAVKFYDYPEFKPTQALLKLKERLEKEMKKESAYEKAHDVRTFKAEYIGCPKCGSKLNKGFLNNNHCPLCRCDLRSKTTLDTLARYKDNQKDLRKKILREERKIQKKMQNRAKTKWFLKIEYHC